MSARFRAAAAGISGAVVAFGMAELIHGLYPPVPSVFVSLAQTVVELTPGGIVTQGIETLGKADVPVLISSMILGALVVAALLANVSLRFSSAAIFIVGVLGVVAVAAAFTDPFAAPIPTVVAVIVSLAAGVAVAEFLLSVAGLREPAKPAESFGAASGPPETPGDVRRREAGGSISVGRGGFLAVSGAAAFAGLVAAGAGRLLARGAPQTSAPHRLNLPDSKQGGGSGGGKKAAVEHETLPEPPAAASIEVPGMPELVTPASSFYLIDTALTSPRVSKESWTLSVGGAVDNPFEMSYKDLLGMSTRESDITLSCVSNPVGGGLVSNGRWTGVLLSDVLAEAGVGREKIGRASEQLVGRSVDGWTSGFKTELALDGREALVAFGLNGSELPIKHGYPVRLVIPGIYGYVSATKWLTEIELTDWDFDAYWIQRTWAKEGPVKTQSRIDTVGDGDTAQPGRLPVGGVAWAPHRGISKVEVSTDGGETWNKARLASQLDLDTWRQYVYDWDAKPGTHTLQVRATDGKGTTQTSAKAPPHPSGASGYHTISVTVA